MLDHLYVQRRTVATRECPRGDLSFNYMIRIAADLQLC